MYPQGRIRMNVSMSSVRDDWKPQHVPMTTGSFFASKFDHIENPLHEVETYDVPHHIRTEKYIRDSKRTSIMAAAPAIPVMDFIDVPSLCLSSSDHEVSMAPKPKPVVVTNDAPSIASSLDYVARLRAMRTLQREQDSAMPVMDLSKSIADTPASPAEGSTEKEKKKKKPKASKK